MQQNSVEHTQQWRRRYSSWALFTSCVCFISYHLHFGLPVVAFPHDKKRSECLVHRNQMSWDILCKCFYTHAETLDFFEWLLFNRSFPWGEWLLWLLKKKNNVGKTFSDSAPSVRNPHTNLENEGRLLCFMFTFDHLLNGHLMNSPLWLVTSGCCCLSLPIRHRGSLCLPDSAS